MIGSQTVEVEEEMEEEEEQGWAKEQGQLTPETKDVVSFNSCLNSF